MEIKGIGNDTKNNVIKISVSFKGDINLFKWMKFSPNLSL